MKKRIGKDFDAVISVQHDGEPINFSQYEVLWVSIDTAYRRTKLKPGTWTTAGGLITAHIPRNLISSAGEHWFTVAYRKPDASIEDGYYDFEDNSESFQIVGKTEDEDAGDLTAKVELLAGLIGKAFTYDDFTPEQLSEIKRPIVESAERADLAIAEIKSDATAFLTNSESILSAQLADNDNKVNQKLLGVDSFVYEKTSEINEKINQTDTAIQNANTATQNANDAASLANSKAELAATATTEANTARDLANEKAVLASFSATNANNVANTYAAELALKELKANKQNSLEADGTGMKFPTVDAVNAGIKAKSNLLVDYTHTSNLEISGFTVDTATGIFTKAGHGLANNDLLYVCINAGTGTLLLKNVTYNEFLSTASMNRYVVNATTNTFQLSLTSGGAAMTTLTPLAGTDISKWHFEKRTAGGLYDSMEFTGIASVSNNATNLKIVIAGSIAFHTSGGHLFLNINDIVADTRYIAYLGSGTATSQSTYTIMQANGFGHVIYDVTCDMNKTVIKKELSFIKDKDLTLYSENQIFVSNRGRIADVIRLFGCYFRNGTTVRIYKY